MLYFVWFNLNVGYQISIASSSSQLASSRVILCDIAWRDINVTDILYLVEYDLQDTDVGLKFTEIQKKHNPQNETHHLIFSSILLSVFTAWIVWKIIQLEIGYNWESIAH